MSQAGRSGHRTASPEPDLSTRTVSCSNSSMQNGLPGTCRPDSGRTLRRHPPRPRKRPPYRRVSHPHKPVQKHPARYRESPGISTVVLSVSSVLPSGNDRLDYRTSAPQFISRKPDRESRFNPLFIDRNTTQSRVDTLPGVRIFVMVRPSSSVGQSIGLLIRGSQVRILPGVWESGGQRSLRTGCAGSRFPRASVAQLDRATDFGSVGRGFESLRAYSIPIYL